MSEKIRFTEQTGFYQELRSRVNEYFTQNKLTQTGGWRIFLKGSIIFSLFITSYVLLVFFTTSWIMAIISAFVLAQGFALIGFNIMHDSVHGSFSKNKKLNKTLGYTLDLIGGSKRLWYHKHNILHHTYTNIAGVDMDLDSNGLLRLSPNQKWRPWHRLQFLYAFPMYSLLTLSMITFTDFHKFFNGRIGNYKLPKPSAGETTLFLLAKIFYFVYTLIIPLFFNPFLYVIGVFLLVHLILGFTFSIVFQLAHTVDENEFPVVDNESGIIENEWAIHQAQTTANFSPKSRLANWYLGGLNFQIEHHLFARISHVHYRKISRIVQNVCTDFGIKYTSYSNIFKAIMVHWKWLYMMGKKPALIVE
ncbi:MAG: fatty acid desaturase [Calditrichaceae bacterium]